jgi:hypothetical protein
MSFLNKFLSSFILVVLGAWILRVSWLKWTNIIFDYGREVYTPWRITCGQVLYKDIASLFGPFPPYFNALLFKIFGVSIMTLVLFNIVLVIGITVLIYRFFSYTTKRWAALLASAVFLSLFALAQNEVDQGAFSYLCPYTYSVTYAVFFSLCAIGLFTAHGRSGRDVLLLAVGTLVGLTALCRFEIFIFFSAAITVGFISKGMIGHWPLGRFLKTGAMALGGFIAPVGIAYLYFSTQLPLSQVAPSILGFNDRWFEIFSNEYIQAMMGLDHTWHNLIIVLTTAACYCLALIAFKCLCVGIVRLEKSGQRWKGAIFVLLGLAGFARVAGWIVSLPYDEIFKGLPLAAMLMAGYLSWLLWRNQQDEGQAKRLLPLLVMAVWGLLMLTKVFLQARINFQGFVYAMPAFMLFVVFFLDFVPRHFERLYKRGYFVQTLASILVLLILIMGLRISVHAYQSRHYYLRAGPDIIIYNRSSEADAGEIAAFLKDIDKIIGKDANFVAFPQGVMLNFLAKKVNPLPYITFMPAEVIRFGEQEMLRSFKEHKPDYVVSSNQWLPVYIYERSAGRRARPATWSWILANYHPVWPVHPGINDMITVFKRSE